MFYNISFLNSIILSPKVSSKMCLWKIIHSFMPIFSAVTKWDNIFSCFSAYLFVALLNSCVVSEFFGRGVSLKININRFIIKEKWIIFFMFYRSKSYIRLYLICVFAISNIWPWNIRLITFKTLKKASLFATDHSLSF